jgi:hypothetical protein
MDGQTDVESSPRFTDHQNQSELIFVHLNRDSGGGEEVWQI